MLIHREKHAIIPTKKPPPWTHIITGNPPLGTSFVWGTYTFKCKQSSLPMRGFQNANRFGWTQGVIFPLPSKTPFHVFSNFNLGFLNLKLPMGGSA